MSNPKGNKKSKMMYKQSKQGHLRTKKSSREKRRQRNKAPVYPATEKSLKKIIVNL
ncbi:hypothetical protein GX888_00805 [Candidatus Dojkabacteria bacterium]|uniref:50S ribosomal protein L35 n=1 Tax=Candidatus Dojkabacteria bacterium TaxID=2099670 RepID=A0A847VCK0_9BACT|nr:hypothetical protein [Candidatus Dojkabacteria bacterium]